MFVRFELRDRRHHLAQSNDSLTQTICFVATHPRRYSLVTHDGLIIARGDVHFCTDKPEYETETLHFNPETEDVDTGRVYPPGFSCYLRVSPEIFEALRDYHPKQSDVELRIFIKGQSIPDLSALRYGDPLGFSHIWDTRKGNPVTIDSIEVCISQVSTEI